MSKRVKVHVGTREDMGKRSVSAWHRLERGGRVRERHVTFPDQPSMLNALTPKRLKLLRDVHREPAPSAKAFAARLGRDYKRVYEDVETLAASAPLYREDGRSITVIGTGGTSEPFHKIAQPLQFRSEVQQQLEKLSPGPALSANGIAPTPPTRFGEGLR